MTTATPPLPPEVAAVFARAPAPAQAQLMRLRQLIFAAAEETGTAPLTETLKWGQPSYLPAKRAGTTLRLGWSASAPDHCSVFVHCQTNLIDQFRERYGGVLQLDGKRALHIAINDPPSEDVLQSCFGLALTYHQRKRA